VEKKFNFVYITTNLVNGKQYVGDHSCDDINCAYTKRYIGSGRPYLKNAINEYGRKNFKKEILEFFTTKQDAFNAQSKYIIQYNTLVPNGYNISPKGGFMKNGSHSEESKEKIRNKNRGRKQTKEHVEKRISKLKGLHHTEESKHLMSINRKGGVKKHTPKSREKMSKAIKAYYASK
jgi:group I intron endonuclease